jgi:hypothetical protein
MTRNLKISLIISILFVGLIRLKPIWERNPGGFWNLLFYLVIAILFFWLIVKIIIEIIRLIKQRKNLTLRLIIPILIMSLLLLDGIFNPLKIDLNSIYGNVIFRACFEGTQNQATFKLLDNNKFEIHWTGVFFYDEYFVGTYEKHGDTLYLDYRWKKPIRFGERILMNNEKEILQTIRSENDSLRNVVPFYYGYCKGLN